MKEVTFPLARLPHNTMGKLKSNKRNSASAGSSPYSKAQAATNNVFKFVSLLGANHPCISVLNHNCLPSPPQNTNVGQHILKNPGVAEAIVAKANLKPTDVCLALPPHHDA